MISPSSGYYFNYRAKTVVLKNGSTYIENNTKASIKVVFFIDDLSVLHSLQSGKEKELNDLFAVLS